MAENVSDDSRLEQLLERWEDLREQGREVSAEELCRECSHLLDALKRRIASLKSMDWLLNKDDDDDEEVPDEAWQDLPQTLGRYRLDEVIGTGGFGQVWKGFDPELQRVVAIKVPRPDRVSSPDQAEKFLEEARKVAQLRHPGIVPVHDVGRDGDWLFIVSDFIDGGNLAQRISQGRPGWRESACLVADIAEILHHAHEQGFVHRDIKPANILLDDQTRPYLTDFGIALSGNEQHSAGTETAGTLAYMSPEQVAATADGLDRRTDIYGLGVVLYELLTGQRPFAAKSPADLRNAILSDQPTPPRAIDPSIPVALERVCLKVLAKEPAGRYSNAADFAAALQAAATSRRQPLVWTAAGLVLVGLLVALGYSKWSGPSAIHYGLFDAGHSGQAASSTLQGPERTAPNYLGQSTKDSEPIPSHKTEPVKRFPVNLLRLVDLKRDAINGNWMLSSDGELHSPEGEKYARIRLFTPPPDEYSLTIVVKRKSDRGKGHSVLVLLLVGQGHPFRISFDMGGDETRLSGDSGVLHKGIVFRRGQKRTVVCICRRDSLVVNVDSESIIQWRGNFKSLRSEGSISDEPGITIGSRNSHFVISKIELEELVPITAPEKT